MPSGYRLLGWGSATGSSLRRVAAQPPSCTGCSHPPLVKEPWNKAASTGIAAEQGHPELPAASPLRTLKLSGCADETPYGCKGDISSRHPLSRGLVSSNSAKQSFVLRCHWRRTAPGWGRMPGFAVNDIEDQPCPSWSLTSKFPLKPAAPIAWASHRVCTENRQGC